MVYYVCRNHNEITNAMKKLVLGVFLGLISIPGIAQFKEVDVEFSKELDLKDHFFKKVVRTDDGYFYTVGSNDRKIEETDEGADFRLTKYEMDGFKVVQKWEVPAFEYKGLETYYIDSYYNKAGFHLIVGAHDKKNETSYVLHRRIGPDGSEDVDEIFSMYAENEDSRALHLMSSEDESCYLIFNSGSADQTDGTSMAMYDQNFRTIWNKPLGELLSEISGFVPDEIKITSDERVYMLGENSIVSRVEGKMKLEKELMLLSYDGEALFVENNFTKGDHEYRFTQMTLFPDVEGELIITGFLSKPKENYIVGNFFLRIDQSGESAGDLKMNFFDQDWLDRLPGGPKDESLGSWAKLNRAMNGLDNVRKGLRAVGFRDLVVWDDGYTAVADRRYTQTSAGYTTANGVYYSGATGYYFEDLLIVNFDQSGNMVSKKHVPKEYAVNPGFETYGKYYLIEGEDEVFVLFNDEKDNAENYADGSDVESIGILGLGVNYARVNRSGETSYGTVSTRKEDDALLYPSQNVEVGIGEGMNVFIKSRKIVKFARFQF